MGGGGDSCVGVVTGAHALRSTFVAAKLKRRVRGLCTMVSEQDEHKTMPSARKGNDQRVVGSLFLCIADMITPVRSTGFSHAVILHADFFSHPVLEVAESLLGKYVVSARGEGMITEVEAYDGPEDKACHGRFGITDRTAPMFGPPGYWYVYLVYGMHWMLNVVTGNSGYPAAVLIRSVGMWDGPGKLTRALGIDGSLNGKKSEPQSGLWVADRGVSVRKTQVQRLPRVGIAYAGEWKDKPYRFRLAAD